MRTLLVLDMSYTLSMFNKFQLNEALESRSLGSFFEQVVSVHPLAYLQDGKEQTLGRPSFKRIYPNHIFISGKLAAFRILKHFPVLNFICAQAQLFRYLHKICVKYQVTVIRIGDPYYLGILGLLLARPLGIPLVIRVCANYDEFVRVSGKPMMPRLLKYRWLEKRIERFVFSRCDLIAGANEDNLRYALANGGREAYFSIFRYGNLIHRSHWCDPLMRPSAYSILTELGLGNATFVVTIARLEPMKRIDHVLRVISILKERGRDVHALIIGGGSERQVLEKAAAAIGVGRRVVFAGNRSQDWIATVLPQAAVILSPHMGRALAEAALAAVPIVAYDFDWQRELVIDGENGYLVRDGNWFEMANKIEILIDHSALAETMGKNARKRVEGMMNPKALELHERQEYETLFSRFKYKK
jgi:glycosyltransferase involved in cell wall biosynthesis